MCNSMSGGGAGGAGFLAMADFLRARTITRQADESNDELRLQCHFHIAVYSETERRVHKHDRSRFSEM